MAPLRWWRQVPLFLRLGFLLLALYIGLELFVTLPGGIVIIYIVLATVGIGIYITLDDRRMAEFLSFFQDDRRHVRRLRRGVLVAVPLIAAFYAYQAVSPSYPPPLQVSTSHPTPPERIWQVQVPPWVLQWREEDIQRGKVLYEANCAYCHGKNLDGKGTEAVGFGYPARPPSFRDPGTVATLTLPYVFWRVSEGGLQNRFNSAMPAWGVGIYSPEETVHTGDLSEEEIWRIIQYIYWDSGRQPAKFDR